MKLGKLRRRKGLKRSPIKRSRKPIRPRNPERKARTFARKFGSVERVEWFKAQPCQTCPSLGPCENSHMIHGGPPEVILSQCWSCHKGPKGLHTVGIDTFAASIGNTKEGLLAMARAQDEEWKSTR